MQFRARHFFTAAIALGLASCAHVFYTEDAYTLARAHQKIAVLPPQVSIAPNRRVTADALKAQQELESQNIQNEMCSWLLRRKMQGRTTIEVLDVATTNARLARAGYPDSAFTPGEWCAKLGVDGVITSSYGMSKPMSEGGAIALGLIFGVWGATNEVTATMSIYDGPSHKLIWNYSHGFSGSVGSSPASLVNALMRQASRKMPYAR